VQGLARPATNDRVLILVFLSCDVAIPSGCIGNRFELAVELFDREHNTPHLRRPRSIADSSPGVLQAFFTPFITREINYGYGFVFAGCNLAAAVFTYFFLYESSGISLEMIDAMYSEPGLKPWQSGKWAPEVSLESGRIEYIDLSRLTARPSALLAALRLEKGSHQGRKEQGRIDDARAQRTRRTTTTIR
jgi:hypothetical protein